MLDVQFVESVPEPTKLAEFEQPDWISSIAIHPRSYFFYVHENLRLISRQHVAVGSYDSTVRILNFSGENVGEFKMHQAPVKCVSWLDDSTCISGAQNGEIFAWKVFLANFFIYLLINLVQRSYWHYRSSV